MKTLTSFFVFVFISVSTLFAVEDATYVANWKLPIYSWLDKEGVVPTVGIDAYPRMTITADSVPANGFDGATGDFDAAWNSIPGDGNVIGSDGHILGLAASAKGTADFTGAFKVLFDEYNMYVLLKYTDDEIVGTESYEIMWAQDFKIDALVEKTKADAALQYYGYSRYAAFGGMKASFTPTTFNNSMLINFDGGGTGAIAWSATSASLSANLFVDNKGATTGAGVVKKVITIGYPALTGEQRPNFDVNIWRALNAGKGISFDLKVVDIDTDDAFNSDATPKQKPAEYWWNATHNSGYLCTWYSGFLAPKLKTNTALKNVATSTVFSKITADKVELNEATTISIYSISGKQLKEMHNVAEVDLTDLEKGAYVLRAKGQTLKVIR